MSGTMANSSMLVPLSMSEELMPFFSLPSMPKLLMLTHTVFVMLSATDIQLTRLQSPTRCRRTGPLV